MLIRSPRPLALSLAGLLSLASCPYDWPPIEPFCNPNAEVCPPATTGESTTATTTTTTAAPTDTGSSAATGTVHGEGEGTATGGPAPAPEIVDVRVDPPVLTVEGEVAVEVEATHTLNIRMQVDDGDELELAPATEGLWTGTVPVWTGLANGPHTVRARAFAGEQVSDPVERMFTVMLPEPGSEAHWDAPGDLGPGMANAVAVSGLHVYELGTVLTDAKQRCYLRRRSLVGQHAAGDTRTLFDGDDCAALALAVDADEALYLLTTRTLMGTAAWRLERLDAWNAPPIYMGSGAPGELARGLAKKPAAPEVAVCSDAPSNNPFDKFDAKVTIFRKDAPGLSPPAFDYQPGMNKHRFRETVGGCAYRGDQLIVAGETFGNHDGQDNQDSFSRLLLVAYHSKLGTVLETTVAEVGEQFHLNSGASGVAVDADGNAITLGYGCGEDCKPTAYLRGFAPGGAPLAWSVSPLLNADRPMRLLSSPAGYVIALGTTPVSHGSQFRVEGWTTGVYERDWQYSHEDTPTLHIALDAATGENGRMYIVGVSQQNGVYVPAFVILNP